MKDTWKINEDTNINQTAGHPILTGGKLFSLNTSTWRKTAKPPSDRAIQNYNNISTENDENINYTFVGEENGVKVLNTRTLPSDFRFTKEYKVSNMRTADDMSMNRSFAVGDMSSYLSNSNMNLGSESVASGFSETVTSADSERTDHTNMGSTTVLVQPATKVSRCWPWIPRVERGLSCISLAACLGNITRLPLAVMLHGGVPFLLVYLLLMFLMGFPLIFLELGIGQIVQQGVTKTWRAVPMFKGVGYVKLIANCIVCVYYPLYIGLALYYLIWIAKGPIPFTECSVVKMDQGGYKAKGIAGPKCLNKTFLEDPLVDPKWFGIYVGLLGFVWLVIMLCSFRKIKTYMRSTNCFFIPTIACLIALLVRAVDHEIERGSLADFFGDIDWNILLKADIWYYALIQLFFSTHLGFGNVVTCAGKVFNKTDPFWAAVGYFIMNIVVGILSVLMCYILSGGNFTKMTMNGLDSNITELNLFAAIYKHAADNPNQLHIWSIVAFFTIFLSGFISMLAIVFTILKAIRVETKKRWLWWHVTAVLCFVFFVFCAMSLLVKKFTIPHIFDHYVVGNILLLATFFEVAAFVIFYGCSNIYVDFEFIMGSKLTAIWKILWCVAPIIMAGIGIWALATMQLTGLDKIDDTWMYCLGWSIVLACLLLIIIVACYEVYIQVDYNLVQKFSSALKASRKWGPVDPMLRHGWIQWRSKTGQGDRDFTLRRRGTRDYTHSVKHRKRDSTLVGTRYVSTTNVSEATTLHHYSTSSLKSDLNENSVSLSNGHSTKHPLQVISITDTLERNPTPRVLKNKFSDSDRYTGSRSVLNPLAVPSMYGDIANESNSEGYGIIRNGPYIIAKDDFDHVCWRKSTNEHATQL